VLLRAVVGYKCGFRNPTHRAADYITLGGVQISAAGIDPQRPGGVTGGFPGREREAVVEELRNGGFVERFRGGELREEVGVWGVIGGGFVGRDVEKTDRRGGLIASEGIGLVCPVEAMRAAGVFVEGMLCLLVVFYHCRQLFRHSWVRSLVLWGCSGGHGGCFAGKYGFEGSPGFQKDCTATRW